MSVVSPEADTDVSSMLKVNGHAETVQKILDVVKKTAYGVDFVLFFISSAVKEHITTKIPL